MDRLDYRRSRSRESYRSGGHRDSTPLAYSGAYRNHSSSRRRSRSYSRERGRHRSRSRDRRSRSRDRRSRSHDHRTRSQSHRSHSRDSRRSSRRRGGRGRSSSSSSSSSDSSDQLRRQREEEKQAKEILAARVFVCNLPYGSFTEADLRHMLDSHGKLKSVNMFVDRGYAFLQYETEADARIAVEEGRGSIWKGRKIDIKMAMEGRRDREGFARRPSPPPPMGLLPLSGVQRPDPDRPDSLTPGRLPRDRSPVRLIRDRSPLRDDRYRDPYRDLRDPPVRRDDPYYDDPYRRLPPPDDPYLDRLRDDRYRGLPPPPPRREPYVDPYLPPQRPLPPPECTVLLTEEQVRPYGELIIRKVKANGLVASIAVLPEDRTIPLAVEDMTRRGTLFAIVITSQNEVHSSVTLNILHGQPQEHRNMPLDDAMSLVARSFDRYVQSVREKAAPPPRPAPGPAPFITPEPGISYLLNLLADNRQLTVVELDKVISYLTERRNKLRGDPPVAESPAVTVAPRAAILSPEEKEATSKAKQQEAAAMQQRQDLQAKILSLFNGDSTKAGPTMANALLSVQGQAMPSTGITGQPAQAPSASPVGTGSSALINFDNPSVQKALDSLIQNPQVLQNIASVSGPAGGLNTPSMMGMGSQHAGQPGIAHTSLATGSRQMPGYRGDGNPMHGGNLMHGGNPMHGGNLIHGGNSMHEQYGTGHHGNQPRYQQPY